MLPGLGRLEAELVESSPHLQLAPPDVHVTWSVYFTRAIQSKQSSLKVMSFCSLRENSLNAVSLGRQIVLPTGVIFLPVEQVFTIVLHWSE